MATYNLTQCVKHINEQLEEAGLPGNMNPRLLRHYQQESIPKPALEGRTAVYTDTHVDAAVALRKAQHSGFSSKAYASTIAASSPVDSNDFQTAAQKALQHLDITNSTIPFGVCEPQTQAITTWTLGNNVRVEMPTQALSKLTTTERKALDLWLAQCPVFMKSPFVPHPFNRYS